MQKTSLVEILSKVVPSDLAADLVEEFATLRQDVSTRTLGRSAPGKFVETLVQILQFLEAGKYDEKPAVDDYLRSIESRAISLSEGLRFCAARVGRAMYTLRNRRSIAHKGQLDPNEYDLAFLLASAQWIFSELTRSVSGISMDEAGKLVAQINAPVRTVVEDFGDRRIVLEKLPVRTEILVLLHSHYPESLSAQKITSALDRHPSKTVRNRLSELWYEKLLEGENGEGYRLTQTGFDRAREIVVDLIRRSEDNGNGTP